jgi:hypothetical protein
MMDEDISLEFYSKKQVIKRVERKAGPVERKFMTYG